jgi:hypothetical protein
MRTLAWRRPARLVPWVGVLCTLGCAAHISIRVPEKAVDSLPLERRLTLLDAESDLLAAQDARDAQEENTLSALDSVKEAERRVNVAEDGLIKEEDAKGNVDVAKAVVVEATSRRDYTRSDLALQRARLATTDAELLQAQAQFELVKATQVVESGEGAKYSVKVESYKRQVDRIVAFVQEQTDKEKKAQATADDKQKAWKTVAEQLAQMTGGAQGSVWVQ